VFLVSMYALNWTARAQGIQLYQLDAAVRN